MCGFGLSQGHLLKDQLEVVKVQLEGRTRYSIKPIEDQLTFDKVTVHLRARGRKSPSCHQNNYSPGSHSEYPATCTACVNIGACAMLNLLQQRSCRPLTALLLLPLAQGFYVFIRAIQTLTTHNSGVVVVRACLSIGPFCCYSQAL